MKTTLICLVVLVCFAQLALSRPRIEDFFAETVHGRPQKEDSNYDDLFLNENKCTLFPKPSDMCTKVTERKMLAHGKEAFYFKNVVLVTAENSSK
ncbi:hypothetical protein QR680_009990 [Steinernema hermaphroditum]|uniref:Uncharacterized protein n=1 Tax=Steinernema hermaphroditum TaxID=289476 RepID=A0AA39IP02_9BILA|nr:hypothetical protein QR680_009990 [Steinernema hermaphroditum]